MRVLALLGQSLDELDARKQKGKGDFVAKLADQMMEDPKAAVLDMLDWLAKIAPPEQAAEAGAGLALNIKELYLNATQTANGHAPGAARLLAGQVVDVVPEPIEAGTTRVHDEATDW